MPGRVRDAPEVPLGLLDADHVRARRADRLPDPVELNLSAAVPDVEGHHGERVGRGRAPPAAAARAWRRAPRAASPQHQRVLGVPAEPDALADLPAVVRALRAPRSARAPRAARPARAPRSPGSWCPRTRARRSSPRRRPCRPRARRARSSPAAPRGGPPSPPSSPSGTVAANCAAGREPHAAVLDGRGQQVRDADEAGHEGPARALVDLLGRAALPHLAVRPSPRCGRTSRAPPPGRGSRTGT